VTNQTGTWISFTGEPGASFTCSVDDGAYEPCVSPYAVNVYFDGSHTLKVKATDAAGNSSEAGSVSWTVDTEAPAPAVIAGDTHQYTNSTSYSVSFTGDADATFLCSVDSAPYTPCTSPLELTGLTDGWHSINVTSVDAAGNKSADASISLSVDTKAPAAPVVTGTATGLTTATSSDVSFTAEAGATFTCSIDGGAWTACTSPLALSGLGLGAHTVSVKATDSIGNVSEAGTVNWTIYPAPVPAGTPVLLTGVDAPAKVGMTNYKHRWTLAIGAAFGRGWDTRGCADLLSVQISTSTVRPSDSQAIPTYASYDQGIRPWAATATRTSRAVPTWVRVGNKAGKWSPWKAVGVSVPTTR
jgi:hypothetical protein